MIYGKFYVGGRYDDGYPELILDFGRTRVCVFWRNDNDELDVAELNQYGDPQPVRYAIIPREQYERISTEIYPLMKHLGSLSFEAARTLAYYLSRTVLVHPTFSHIWPMSTDEQEVKWLTEQRKATRHD